MGRPFFVPDFSTRRLCRPRRTTPLELHGLPREVGDAGVDGGGDGDHLLVGVPRRGGGVGVPEEAERVPSIRRDGEGVGAHEIGECVGIPRSEELGARDLGVRREDRCEDVGQELGDVRRRVVPERARDGRAAEVVRDRPDARVLPVDEPRARHVAAIVGKLEHEVVGIRVAVQQAARELPVGERAPRFGEPAVREEPARDEGMRVIFQ
mmetsp:Transcript_21783/g.86487  ORF Transcript_21783/g.86487 Transcript_21783/m.86487 type:complete len:209 (+) Transcript_21783:192-818(+)